MQEKYLRGLEKEMVFNNKGSLLDGIVAFLVLFILAITIIVGAFIYNEIEPQLLSVTDSTTVDSVLEKGGAGIDILDYTFLMFYIAGILGMIISGFVTNSHPVFFIAAVLVTVVSLLFVPIMANVYEDLTTGTTGQDFASTAEAYPITNVIMNNYPIFFLGAMIAFIVSLYGKTRRYT